MDIVDGCNLKCPSCWRGANKNKAPGGKRSATFLDFEAARRSLDHISANFKQVAELLAFNWGEPLLCENLKDYVELFARYPQVELRLSSNMNAKIDKDLPGQILPYTKTFVFSVSGFRQRIYKRYHQGGNIKKAFGNIELFLRARELTKASTVFHLAFGRNLYNARDEEPLREFCEKNGIEFVPMRYYLTDAQDVYKASLGEAVPKERWELFYENYSELRKDVLKRLTPNKCPLIRKDIVLDTEGRLMTCCATQVNTGVYIWDIPNADALEAARLDIPFCKKCFTAGVSGYFFD